MAPSKYQETSPGRPYAEVRGYLRAALIAATVESEILTPQSAAVAVYGLNADGEWRYKCEATVWNYDETTDIEAETYVRASLNSDNRFEVFWAACTATELTIPASPLD